MGETRRVVWTFWADGFDAAPPLVRACLRSWERQNPGWEVRPLDLGNLERWAAVALDLDRPDITVQKQAAIARLALLRRHGGVWVDATVFCLRPLDDWLGPYAEGGFFAFRDPGPDRMSSNWFLAAEPDDPLLVALHDRFLGLWQQTRFTRQNTRAGRALVRRLTPLLATDHRRTQLWLRPLLLRGARVYPYFIFHYVFNGLILRDAALRARWGAARPFPAGLCHALQEYAAEPGGIERALSGIAGHGWPLQKLDWRVDAASPYWSAVLPRLEDSIP